MKKKKEDKKVIEKTVNRTGKEISEDKLVMKDKKTKEKEKREKIRKLNEEVLRQAQDKSRSKKVDKRKPISPKATSSRRKKGKEYELSVGMRELFKAGCHLGHGKSKTHPKARTNIYTTKNKIEVFDLAKTVEVLKEVCTYVHNLSKKGEKLIMVGTKRQAREVVKRVAIEVGVPYVTDRWLGGTITNWHQIKKNIEKLKSLREDMEAGKFANRTKKEQSVLRKEIVRLERIVGGLVDLTDIPKAIFVVDIEAEKTAVREAKRIGIKVIGICDSNVDPGNVDFAIPSNDDNVKSISIIVEEIGKAIKSN